MYDVPDHFPIDVNADGDGPARPDEAVATVCWCGRAGCEDPEFLDRLATWWR